MTTQSLSLKHDPYCLIDSRLTKVTEAVAFCEKISIRLKALKSNPHEERLNPDLIIKIENEITDLTKLTQHFSNLTDPRLIKILTSSISDLQARIQIIHRKYLERFRTLKSQYPSPRQSTTFLCQKDNQLIQ